MIKRWFRYLFILGLLGALLGAASLYWLYYYYPQTRLQLAEPVIFEISKGESFGGVAQQLEQQQVLPSALLLKVYGRISGLAIGLQAGEYTLNPNESVAELLNQFIEGRVNRYSITLVEGRTVKEMLAELAQHPKLDKTLNTVTSVTLLSELGVGQREAEGLFFADTYYFIAGDSDRSILQRAYDKAQQVLQQEWEKRQPDLPYQTPYEGLIMASMIEKETGATYERAEIAGVFVRRLQKKMRLQSDPTVIYGMGEDYDGNIRRRHLRQQTPYNTYMIPALPPTPIALVGREAINAALNPAEGSSLYFVARGDGTHQFSDTLQEHNRAVRRYQLKRRADYRSSPPTAVAEKSSDTDIVKTD